MGQTIEILKTTVVDRVLVVDTDRSLGGQDGEAFASAQSTEGSETFPARLSARVFQADSAVDHVFVMSNTVSIRRSGGWAEDEVASTARLVSDFFRFYL